MPTTTTERCDFELSEVEAAVGARAFDRSRAYARRGRVLELDWDPDGQALTGSVVGQGASAASPYDATVETEVGSSGRRARR